MIQAVIAEHIRRPRHGLSCCHGDMGLWSNGGANCHLSPSYLKHRLPYFIMEKPRGQSGYAFSTALIESLT